MSTQAISSCGDEVLIAVVGRPGSGKTSFIRQATSSKRRLSSYFAILSPTQRVEAAHPIRLLGKVVTLIDTPGYDRNRPSRGQTGRGLAETELVSKILSFLSATFGEGRKLDGIIFVHHAWHTRHTKSSDMDVWKPVLAQSATVDNIIVVGTATIRGTLSNVGHVHGGEAARKASVSTRSNTSESASSSGVDVPAENCFSNNMIIFNINSRKSAQDAVCRVMDAYIVAPESGADTIGSRESWHTCLTDVSPDPQDRSIVDGSESPQTPEDKDITRLRQLEKQIKEDRQRSRKELKAIERELNELRDRCTLLGEAVHVQEGAQERRYHGLRKVLRETLVGRS